MVDELTLRDVLQQMGARLGRVEEDVRALRAEMDRRFGRMMQLQVTLLLALVVGIGGLWLK